MSQESPSTSKQLKSTWGKFLIEQAAIATKTELEEAGIEPEKITLETEDFQPPIKIEDTGAIANLKTGAITGAVLGALIGLSISLVLTNFSGVGLAAFKNFQTINYLAPIMGAIVGAVGISLISGLSGASIPQSDLDIGDRSEGKKYLVVVKGTTEEVSLAREIINRQGGVVEEADRR